MTCWLQSAAQWVAQQVVNALQPVIDAILNSPLNILTQTPPADTYQNPTLITWFAAFLTVVDLALASLIVITSTSTSVGLCSPANMVPSFAQTVLPQFLHR